MNLPGVIGGNKIMSSRPECGEDCLQFVELDFPAWDSLNACKRSAKRGHLECLRYAHESGCLWDGDICIGASRNGHLECLRYAHEHGCPWDENTCSVASLNGRMECLRYAHEHGCPWDGTTCYYASMADQLDCLRYAHERGCPWDERTCEGASRKGHLRCLVYAHEHDCPWNDGTCASASHNGKLECLRYALENGCPVPNFTEIIVSGAVVPYLYHRGLGVGLRTLRGPVHKSEELQHHIQEHARRSWTLLRCVVGLLGAYHRACERVYSPDGVGYHEAETSFREAVLKN